MQNKLEILTTAEAAEMQLFFLNGQMIANNHFDNQLNFQNILVSTKEKKPVLSFLTKHYSLLLGITACSMLTAVSSIMANEPIYPSSSYTTSGGSEEEYNTLFLNNNEELSQDEAYEQNYGESLYQQNSSEGDELKEEKAGEPTASFSKFSAPSRFSPKNRIKPTPDMRDNSSIQYFSTFTPDNTTTRNKTTRHNSSTNSTARPFNTRKKKVETSSSGDDSYTENMEAICDQLISKQLSKEKERTGGGLYSYVQKKSNKRDLPENILIQTQDLIDEIDNKIQKNFKKSKQEIEGIFLNEEKKPKNQKETSDAYARSWIAEKRAINEKITPHFRYTVKKLETIGFTNLGMQYLTEGTFSLYFNLLKPINLYEDLYRYVYKETHKKNRPTRGRITNFERSTDRSHTQFKFKHVTYNELIKEICQHEKCPANTIVFPDPDSCDYVQIFLKDTPYSLDPIYIWEIKNKIFLTYIHSFSTEISRYLDNEKYIRTEKHKILMDYYTYSCEYIMDAYAFRNKINQYLKTFTGERSETRTAFLAFKNLFENMFWEEFGPRLQNEIKSWNEKVELSFESTDRLVAEEGLTGAVRNSVSALAKNLPTAAANSPTLSVVTSVGYSLASGLYGYMSGTPTTTTTTTTASNNTTKKGWFFS